jgi:hypothetical protein
VQTPFGVAEQVARLVQIAELHPEGGFPRVDEDQHLR